LGWPIRVPAPAARITAARRGVVLVFCCAVPAAGGTWVASAVMGTVIHTMIDVSDSELRAALTAALSVERWITEVAAAAPFASGAELLRVAHSAATPLSEGEITEAIAHHPRIGEKPVGEGTAQTFSRSEQQSVDAEDADLGAALAAGNAAYEEKFGRVFLIRAAGRSRAEILGELQRRMQLDDSDELVIVGEQLRDIAVLRLEKLFESEFLPTGGAST
jgi:2-oxo-4-hydroxy-4-carboxy-5-ureidoimidazoline decarboxylase